MTTVVTENRASVLIPSHLLEKLLSLDTALFGAYVRLKWRCDQSPIIGIYEATWESLARLGITTEMLCQLRALNLIHWTMRPKMQHISVVER